MAKKQDSYYFDNFSACAEYSLQAARLLGGIMKGFNADELESYTAKMHEIEHAADMKKHELMEVLIKAFITPIDREDIMEVSRNLDDLTDKLEDVVIRLYCNNVTAIRHDAIELTEVVIKLCQEVSGLMKNFRDVKHPKNLKEHIIRINSLEEDADRLYIKAMHDLHTETNVMEVIAWRDIYTYLEKCSDTAEHVADIVESVVLKNS